jgi:hypothetical protein
MLDMTDCAGLAVKDRQDKDKLKLIEESKGRIQMKIITM